MKSASRIPGARDKTLFTPGPLTTSHTVREAMLRDLGSRDAEFIATVQRVRQDLLTLAGVSKERGYEAVPVQGSGTFGLEAVISSAVPPGGKLLVVINGAYGDRIAKIAAVQRIGTAILKYSEDLRPDPDDIGRKLSEDSAITSVAVVHCETTTGIMNPVEDIGRLVKEHGKKYLVDAMSSFGAVPLDLEAAGVDYLVSSANKCIEGVPGFSFVICRREALLETEGWARTLSLDLLAQWKGLEANGQFRFTPPTHALLAFERALCELDAEGGVAGRGARYRANHECLVSGMRAMGFEEYLEPEVQGHIITSFRYPEHPGFTFDEFYRRLSDRGFVVYPGKVSDADCFRIGTIGRIFESDVRALLGAVRETLAELRIDLNGGRERE